MDDNLARIINESNRILSKLQLLAVFFEEEVIYKIYLRSQVVHKLFEGNAELDINKLELFHLQYTTSVIDLLKKIKKTNEQNVILLFEEIQLNKELITQLNNTVSNTSNFNAEKLRQATKLSISLRKLYHVLSEDANEYPFSNNIHSFSARFGNEFFQQITTELLGELIAYVPAQVYSNSHAIIQRKLLGLLCKHDFKVSFFNGYKCGGLMLEVYRLLESDKYFLFLPSKSLFLFCEPSKLETADLLSTGFSKKENLLHELKAKNAELESRVQIIKSSLPQKIKVLLDEYLQKISEVDFLLNNNFDIQANILKTMLNTDNI